MSSLNFARARQPLSRLLLSAPKRVLSSPTALDRTKGARWYETYYEMRSVKYHQRCVTNPNPNPAIHTARHCPVLHL
jgi:hypothetical protein